MRVEKYLDDAIARHGLKNDTALAKLLGVRQNAVSQYRSGTRTMDNEMCLRLAQLLDMENPMPIIMAADMDRAERAGQRSLWEVFSPRMAHSGLVALLVALLASVTNFVTPSPAQAAQLSHSEGRTLCIMLNHGMAKTAPPTKPLYDASNPIHFREANLLTPRQSASRAMAAHRVAPK